MDAIDRSLAGALQENAELTRAELAARVGVAPSTAHERVRRLEQGGHITGYHARLNLRSFGLGATAFVYVDAGVIAQEEGVGERLKSVEGVEEIHHVAGEDSYLVKIRAANMESLGRILRTEFGEAGARSTRTTVVLETLLDRPGVALPAEPEDAGAEAE